MKFLKIHPRDTVAVALERSPKGTSVVVDGVAVVLRDDVPAGHKFALAAMPAGAAVVKYGYSIGTARTAIAVGDWVHEHNVATALSGAADYAYQPKLSSMPAPARIPTFDGYVRDDGQVGIRNELWILPMVGCVNGVAEAMARTLKREGLPGTVEEVVVMSHPFGCSQLGDDHGNTQKILAGLAHHPNAGGVLLLWLGCENNTPESFMKVLGEVDPRRVRSLVCQQVPDEQEAGLALLRELAAEAGKCQRRPVPMSELKIGFKCGGSDAFSGLTANPLVGRICDKVTAAGGSAVLTEVPEMFGAETILFNRCASREVFDRAVAMVNGFKDYFIAHHEPVGENPSPGNRAGGITTLEDKSLGCIQKGGDSVVTDVLAYGERLRRPGLSLMDGPGNDIVATTALAAAGCHLVLFTTGRGTPLGGPVPVLKIATNSALAATKSGWIDFDAGQALAGVPMEALAEQLLSLVLGTASGKPTRSEQMGFRDVAIWKTGVTL